MEDLTKEIGLLNRAVAEIKNLRKQNELMRARLDMFDAIKMILQTRVQEHGGTMSPDLCWEIERFIHADSQKTVPEKYKENGADHP